MPPKKSDNALELKHDKALEHVIVTGAGSGIGKEFVKLFLQDGANVLAVSLIEEELNTLKEEFSEYSGVLYTLKIDLSKENACELVENWCQENRWSVDTLVNNAGFAIYSECVEYDQVKVRSLSLIHI